MPKMKPPIKTDSGKPAGRQPIPAGQIVKHAWLLLGLILVLAAGVRITGLGSKSLWLDELWTAELSTGRGSLHLTLPANQIMAHPVSPTRLDDAPPWYKVWTNLGDVTHPPLYFIVLRLWRSMFGQGDVAMRSLSVVASLAGIVLLFDIGRNLHGPGPALWACLIMALAQPQIEAAQETRNYAFLLAAGLAACAVLVRIGQRGAVWPRVILLWLCVLATVMVHYFAVGMIAGLLAYALLVLKGQARWRAAGAIVAAGLAFLVIWGPSMWVQRGRFSPLDQTTVFLLETGPEHTPNTLSRVMALPSRYLMQAAWDLVPGPSVVVAGGLCLLLLLKVRRRPHLWLPCFWAGGTIGVVAGMDFFRSTIHLQYIRYTLLAAPALYLLISAVLWSDRDGILRHLLPALAVTACILGLSDVYKDTNPNWPALARYLDQRIAPGDLLVVAKPALPQWTGYDYVGFAHYTTKPLPATVILRSPTPPGLLEGAPRIWLINGSPQISPREIMPGYVPRGQKIDRLNVSVWEMQRAGQ